MTTTVSGEHGRDVVPVMPWGRRLRLLARVAARGDRKLMGIVAAMLVVTSLVSAAQALALKWIVDGAVDGQVGLATAGAVMGGLAIGAGSAVGRALIEIPGIVSGRGGLKINVQTLDRTAGMPGIEHLERADFLDQVELVRMGGNGLVRSLFSLARSTSTVVRLVLGLWLIATVHPLLVAVPLFALPSILLAPRAQRYVDQANSQATEDRRAAVALHGLFTNPTAAMEIRVFGCSESLDRRAHTRWLRAASIRVGGATRSAAVSSLGWVILTGSYVAALLFTAYQASQGQATAGDVVLVSQLALQLRGNVAEVTGVARTSAGAMRTVDRYLWLEDLAQADRARYNGTTAVPRRLTDGISFEHVSFTYPGTTTPVLSNIDIQLPAGSTVAIVGDNGAGKTSLVKLIAGLYRPTSGRILVDGTDLADLNIIDWRTQLGAGFQDFLRLEAIARHSIGSGDPPAMDDDQKVQVALERASSQHLPQNWPAGLSTHLGKTYHDGIELSGGQWQRVAIARAMMRPQPLCLILDEPTAALDPAAEHALFERYTGAAHRVTDNRGITIIVSHRFSTVGMADHIIVLENGKIAETGTHIELLNAGGTYARMYQQQAAAYTSSDRQKQA